MAHALHTPTALEAPVFSPPPAAAPASNGVHELRQFVEAVMASERLEAARLSPRVGFALIAVTSAFLWLALGAIVL